MKNESVYDKLKKEGYTDEEIAESFIFPRERTEEEEKQWAAELNAHRKKYTLLWFYQNNFDINRTNLSQNASIKYRFVNLKNTLYER